MRYLLIDASNCFFRARHAAPRQASDWDRIGFAIHVTLASIQKCWRLHKSDHVVFCLEGRSWRKDVYPPYKRNRELIKSASTVEEQKEAEMFFTAYNALVEFIKNETNCTVLHHEKAEADDLIARFIALHPNDHHVIISSDTDFIQLLDSNVEQYNGITNERHTLDGIYNDRGNLVIDKKTKNPKTIPDPKWLLFEKCIRGDATDNIFSAYPGVREKSSKNKVGLREAFMDREKQGFTWNNLMLQRWTDHNGVEHRVLDDYDRNQSLIDLTKQPQELKNQFDEAIRKSMVKKAIPMVGARLMKFCGKYQLNKISDNAVQYAEFLTANYFEG
jgi:5'-3' exonuclease